MKNIRSLCCGWLRVFCAVTLAYPIVVLAQGSLTPPGAPAPLMKSLDQIEPRIPVDAVHTPGNGSEQFIISQPGSYYLTTNIVGVNSKDGIQITADNVILDLNGFSLLGVAGSVSGINSSGRYVVVRNGVINGWQSIGINDVATSVSTRMFERLMICSNASYGILTGQGAIVRDCVIEGNGSFGIYASGGSWITGCTVDGNSFAGIGVEPPGSCVVMNNFAFGNDTSGFNGEIYMNSGSNHVEGNRVIVTSATGYGIYIYPISRNTNNVVIRNDVAGGGARNFNLFPGNDIGPIGTATNSTSPWANFSH
jgi:hypothetical protein